MTAKTLHNNLFGTRTPTTIIQLNRISRNRNTAEAIHAFWVKLYELKLNIAVIINYNLISIRVEYIPCGRKCKIRILISLLDQRHVTTGFQGIQSILKSSEAISGDMGKEQTSRKTRTKSALYLSAQDIEAIDNEMKRDFDSQRHKTIKLVAVLKTHNRELQTELSAAKNEINLLKKKCAKLESANKQFEAENVSYAQSVDSAMRVLSEARVKGQRLDEISFEEFMSVLNKEID